MVVRHSRLLALLVILLTGLSPALGGETAPGGAVQRLQRDITFLASAECEGRGVTTKGINLAADYIAAEFKKAGLQPAGPDGSYFQPFTMPGAKIEKVPSLVLRGPQGQVIELQAGVDFHPLGLTSSGTVSAPLVFAGYGITVKDEKQPYDDFEGLDVAEKVIVILRDTPRTDNKFAAFANRRLAQSLTAKLTNAQKNKALAVLFVNDHETAIPDDLLMDFNYNSTSRSPIAMPSVHMRRSILDRLLQTVAGTPLRSVEEDIDRDLKPRSQELTGWTVTLDIKVSRTPLAVKNVVGVVEGVGPLANETIVIGAHYDHIGYGGMGSLAPSKRPTIHHGADDNGSGTTTLLEVARRFGQRKDYQGRRLLFIAFSGEESGLLGSRFYCDKPLFPLAQTVAMINMDMVGRLRPDEETKKGKLAVYGTGTAAPFDRIVSAAGAKNDLKVQKVPGTQLIGEVGSSDHESFYSRKVPVLFLFTGVHAEYHRPTDVSSLINLDGMSRIADMVTEMTDDLSRVTPRPEYIKVAGGSAGPRLQGRIPRIGIRPSYGDDKEGVLLDGVTEGAPAEKAGLKAGDRIVEIGGQQVKNIEAYMTLLAAQKQGGPVVLGVLREGKKLTVKIVPE